MPTDESLMVPSRSSRTCVRRSRSGEQVMVGVGSRYRIGPNATSPPAFVRPNAGGACRFRVGDVSAPSPPEPARPMVTTQLDRLRLEGPSLSNLVVCSRRCSRLLGVRHTGAPRPPRDTSISEKIGCCRVHVARRARDSRGSSSRRGRGRDKVVRTIGTESGLVRGLSPRLGSRAGAQRPRRIWRMSGS